VKKNRDDLKELCESIMEIVGIVQRQISVHVNSTVLEFKNLCQDLERYLTSVSGTPDAHVNVPVLDRAF
jgi:hypothetical protein